MMAKAFPQVYHDFYKTNGTDTVFHTEGPSMARQEFAEECDINVIMQKYQKTGMLPANGAMPMYVDWLSVPRDLMSMVSFLEDADAAFMQLPAGVRREFDNDAALFVEFASDPKNIDQMREWGLAPKPAAESAQAASAPAPIPAASTPAPSPEPAKAGSSTVST